MYPSAVLMQQGHRGALETQRGQGCLAPAWTAAQQWRTFRPSSQPPARWRLAARSLVWLLAHTQEPEGAQGPGAFLVVPAVP